jgi:D-alanyl-D-alanine carboxypeptidase (penicillin-binding protein 5/6)
MGVALVYAQVFSYQPARQVSAVSAAFAVATSTMPVISAPAYAVFDAETGAILASADMDTLYPIASVTKLFTAVAILETFNPESTTTIAWSDVAGEGEAGKLHPNEVYSYRELLFPLLLESSNDAADTLERATGAQLLPAMAAVAAEYGATHSTFADASGLSAENVSTVHDLIAFSRAIGEKYPFVYDISKLQQYIGVYTGWRNNNPVAQMDEYRGGKHGYIMAAGRTIVAHFDESFSAGHRTLGYVILGSEDLRSDVSILRDFVHNSVDYK